MSKDIYLNIADALQTYYEAHLVLPSAKDKEESLPNLKLEDTFGDIARHFPLGYEDARRAYYYLRLIEAKGSEYFYEPFPELCNQITNSYSMMEQNKAIDEERWADANRWICRRYCSFHEMPRLSVFKQLEENVPRLRADGLRADLRLIAFELGKGHLGWCTQKLRQLEERCTQEDIELSDRGYLTETGILEGTPVKVWTRLVTPMLDANPQKFAQYPEILKFREWLLAKNRV